jgi:hypothetical protein
MLHLRPSRRIVMDVPLCPVSDADLREVDLEITFRVFEADGARSWRADGTHPPHLNAFRSCL